MIKHFGDKKSKYAGNDVMEKVIKNCRGVKNRQKKYRQRKIKTKFQTVIRFKENEVFESKEYSIIKQIKKVFIRQKMIDQYKAEKYFIDLFFWNII